MSKSKELPMLFINLKRTIIQFVFNSFEIVLDEIIQVQQHPALL